MENSRENPEKNQQKPSLTELTFQPNFFFAENST